MHGPLFVPVLVLSAALLAGCGTGPGEEPGGGGAPPDGGARTATVTRVVDGDTLVVDGGERVRLIGIDTPESADPRQPVECFGREAAAAASRMLPPGRRVRLERDVEARDRFGRTLSYVYRLPDGLFVNAALLEQGYATPLTLPPNVAQADRFRRLAREARRADRGLWAACRN